MNKKRLKQVAINYFGGHPAYQKLFEKMYKASLIGMGMWAFDSCDNTGEIDLIRRLSENSHKGAKVIFDVGANVGDYAQSVIDIFGNGEVELHCFEPAKGTFGKLLDRFSDSEIILNRLGVSNERGKMILYSTGKEGCELASVYPRDLGYQNRKLEQEEIVEAITIDEYCLEKGIKEIFFLKIDVEGHEIKVLEGAKNMLDEKRIKYLQFEFGECNVDSRIYFRDFWKLLAKKYDIGRVIKGRVHPIREYSPFLENFTWANYFASAKE